MFDWLEFDADVLQVLLAACFVCAALLLMGVCEILRANGDPIVRD